MTTCCDACSTAIPQSLSLSNIMQYPSISAYVAFLATCTDQVARAAVEQLLYSMVATATEFDIRASEMIWPDAIKG